MERITQQMLEARVAYLNSLVGVEKPAYNVVGSYQTDYAYGGVSIIKISNVDGGCSIVIYRGTKRETFGQLCSFINGYVQGREDEG